MRHILRMYVTLMSVILAGAANMVFVKTRLYRKGNVPIDGGRLWKDGRRIFGENKTRNGFLGMIVLGALAQLLWGAVCGTSERMTAWNQLYTALPNRPAVNLIAGALFGLAYVLFELPNSFLKRRINIPPGQKGSGAVGAACFVLDQIDSLLGVALVLHLLCGLTLAEYCGYLAVGAVTHIAVNLILYALRIRKTI